MRKSASARWATVTVLVLATAATAHAECAWVLWRQDIQNMAGTYREEWTTPVAYQDRASCVAVIAKRVQIWQESHAVSQEVRPGLNDTTAEFVTGVGAGAGYSTYRLHCLPDTIDPRGAKR